MILLGMCQLLSNVERKQQGTQAQSFLGQSFKPEFPLCSEAEPGHNNSRFFPLNLCFLCKHFSCYLYILYVSPSEDFSGGSGVKNPPANAGDTGSRSLGERNGSPLQYSCLDNPMDRGAWQVIAHEVAEELDMTGTKTTNNSNLHQKVSTLQQGTMSSVLLSPAIGPSYSFIHTNTQTCRKRGSNEYRMEK